MPLNRPALALSAGPRAVQQARRWVATTMGDIERDDLVECAQLGVSELVTNALLHGTQPIRVAVRGTREHPRVEVRDGSREPPVMPEPVDSDDLESMLQTFGRGLGIVSRAADAWGAEIEEDGKVVWFTPRTEVTPEATEGVVTGVAPADQPPPGSDDAMGLEIRGVPVAPYTAFQRHYRELRREVRLLALAHEEDYPLAKTLSDLFGALEKPLQRDLGAPQVDAARAAGETTVDLRVRLRPDDIDAVGRLVELLDLADAFCREERLLSLARSPGQQAFQHWFLGEVVRRASGEPPVPWAAVGHDDERPAERRFSVS